jgi:hypothetical protein
MPDAVQAANGTITIGGKSYRLDEIHAVQVELFGMGAARATTAPPGRETWMRNLGIVCIALIFLYIPTTLTGLAAEIIYIAQGRCCSQPDPLASALRLTGNGMLALVLLGLGVLTLITRQQLWLKTAVFAAGVSWLAHVALTAIGILPQFQVVLLPSDPLAAIPWLSIIFLFVVTQAGAYGYGTSVVLGGEFGAVVAYRSNNPWRVSRVYRAVREAVRPAEKSAWPTSPEACPVESSGYTRHKARRKKAWAGDLAPVYGSRRGDSNP